MLFQIHLCVLDHSLVLFAIDIHDKMRYCYICFIVRISCFSEEICAPMENI